MLLNCRMLTVPSSVSFLTYFIYPSQTLATEKKLRRYKLLGNLLHVDYVPLKASIRRGGVRLKELMLGWACHISLEYSPKVTLLIGTMVFPGTKCIVYIVHTLRKMVTRKSVKIYYCFKMYCTMTIAGSR